MKVVVLTSPSSWFTGFHGKLKEQLSGIAQVSQLDFCSHHKKVTKDYDVALLLSYFNIVPAEFLKRHRHNLVVHESDLPEGRGMSPLTWQVLEGASEITICLLEATENVDAGLIYLKRKLALDGTELVSDLRNRQGNETISLVEEFFRNYSQIQGQPQEGTPSYYPRRTPSDSLLSLDKTLEEQFNLLRVCDNERYPAYFERNGVKYKLLVEKIVED